MPVTAPPSITTLPTPPDPNDRATFNARAYPWSVAQQTFATEVGAVATNVAANATDAAASATAADDRATDADAARIAAEAAQAAAEAVVATIPEGTINDATTSLVSVWSSTKTNTELGTKQATLVSGTNIKTLGGASLLGSGDVVLPSGALVYLGTVTASNVATADITGLDTWGATYDKLIVVGTDVRPATSAVPLRMQFRQNSTWQTTNYRYTARSRSNAGNGTDFYGSTGTFVELSNISVNNASAKEYVGLQIDIDKPSDKANVEWTIGGFSVSQGVVAIDGYAYRDNTPAALQGIRITASSGNISGTFRVYGISKT